MDHYGFVDCFRFEFDAVIIPNWLIGFCKYIIINLRFDRTNVFAGSAWTTMNRRNWNFVFHKSNSNGLRSKIASAKLNDFEVKEVFINIFCRQIHLNRRKKKRKRRNGKRKRREVAIVKNLYLFDCSSCNSNSFCSFFFVWSEPMHPFVHIDYTSIRQMDRTRLLLHLNWSMMPHSMVRNEWQSNSSKTRKQKIKKNAKLRKSTPTTDSRYGIDLLNRG